MTESFKIGDRVWVRSPGQRNRVEAEIVDAFESQWVVRLKGSPVTMRCPEVFLDPFDAVTRLGEVADG